MTEVRVSKSFTFDSAHQLIGHKGKCANLHGHTYRLDVVLRGHPVGPEHVSDEGFVIDFGDIKEVVKEKVVDRLDHAFLSAGNEPVLETLRASGSKVMPLGFRTTAENMCMYICHTLVQAGLPVDEVRLWETATSWAEVKADSLPADGPFYAVSGGCDLE